MSDLRQPIPSIFGLVIVKFLYVLNLVILTHALIGFSFLNIAINPVMYIFALCIAIYFFLERFVITLIVQNLNK